MDVGNYISELLALHGEVSVPGLGYFAHTRVNGHYNEQEGRFYPPSYSVQFDPQFIDDETLPKYIADKKNISVASAKYFTEKYINTIKMQAQNGDAPLADLGCFYMEDSKLFFETNQNQRNSPDFFGYEPLSLHKVGSAPVQPKQLTQENTTPAPIEVNIAAPAEILNPADDDDYLSEEEEAYLVNQVRKRKRRTSWLFIILMILFTAGALYLVNRYNPALFNVIGKKRETATKQPVKDTKVINAAIEVDKDTAATDTPKTQPATHIAEKPIKDTTAKNTAPVVKDEVVAGPRFEIMGGSFKDDKEANTAIANYKKLGVDAHIVTDAPGRRVKLSLGTYKTRAEAEAARKAILATKKVNKDIYTLEIKPKL
ncbi:SPOR domain-containing protein [Mucilaginibacter sp.]|uniref:HU domain-containing protein n=1 Tax=Mucilaginibacter sp. TaxID=1882438 RepID=UPI000CB4D846|nr:SPOR domain-containing protein [Mucilaginibacter sp.]PLW88919.1 MAG: hypothetical protein C0154_14140 [Mucilaginibacter sp.]HEK22173.1 hypothetical protein [Bacteroidota bacterium]